MISYKGGGKGGGGFNDSGRGGFGGNQFGKEDIRDGFRAGGNFRNIYSEDSGGHFNRSR